MRAQVNSSPGRAAGAGGSEQPEQAEQPSVELILAGVPSDLVAQWGAEYFVVGLPPEAREAAALASGTRELASNSSLKQVVTARDHAPRDFWSEVAALSSAGVTLPPNGLGTKPDLVAYAIATVSAKYAIVAESKPGILPGWHSIGTTTQRAVPAAPTATASSTASSERHFDLAACDWDAVLESLLDFEHAAVLGEVRHLDASTFDHMRGRAARAIIAANVIRDSALKSAEGRRG